MTGMIECRRSVPLTPPGRRGLPALIGIVAVIAFDLGAAWAPGGADAGVSFGSRWPEQQARVWQAVREGRHEPLSTVVGKLQRRVGGRELDARLERLNGRAVYRVRWISEAGVRTDFVADAQTGHIQGVAALPPGQ